VCSGVRLTNARVCSGVRLTNARVCSGVRLTNARVCSGVRLTNDDHSVERKLTVLTAVKTCYLIVTKWGTSDQLRTLSVSYYSAVELTIYFSINQSINQSFILSTIDKVRVESFCYSGVLSRGKLVKCIHRLYNVLLLAVSTL